MSPLTGTGTLLRLALRRDRILAPAWVGRIVLVVVGAVQEYARMYPTAEMQRAVAADLSQVPALLAFTGQINSHTFAGMIVGLSGDIAYSLMALLAPLTAIRHTRAEEDAGRLELVGSGAVGRYAPLTASLVVTCGVSLVAGLATTLGLLGTGLGFDAAGSVAFGLGIAAPGFVFAAVAAVAAQVTNHARSARLLAGLVFGVAYTLRFVADGSGALWLRWLSPTGWSHLLRPYAGEQWWVLVLPLAATLVLAAVACRLTARRDLGEGALPERDGVTTAVPSLRSGLALAWRLQRGPLLVWTAAAMIGGAAFAGPAAGMAELTALTSSGAMDEFYRIYAATPDASLADTYLWVVILSLGYVVSLYSLLATLRLRAEEVTGRAEATLATPVGRLRWAMGHLAIMCLGTTVMMAGAGLTAGLSYGLATGDVPTYLPRVLAAALVQVPAALVIGAVAMLAFGLLPRLAVPISWGAFMFFNLFGEIFGPAFGLDYGIANQVIPFHHLPKLLSGGEFTAAPLLVMAGLTAGLTAAGLAGLRRRDLA